MAHKKHYVGHDNTYWVLLLLQLRENRKKIKTKFEQLVFNVGISDFKNIANKSLIPNVGASVFVKTGLIST